MRHDVALASVKLVTGQQKVVGTYIVYGFLQMRLPSTPNCVLNDPYSAACLSHGRITP